MTHTAPQPQDGAIVVRRMNFEFSTDIDPVFIAGQPEESYTNLALSLLLPYLEPYLIRSMRAARPKVTDPTLAAELDAFTAQEGQHYRQHARFNAALRAKFSGVEALERELDEDYKRFTSDRSLRFNLAYAEGFESLTAVMACDAARRGFDGWSPAARDLFEWHLLEELEHRTVAFDVYQKVCGDYFYRVIVGFYAQWHLLRFVYRATMAMLAADPALLERHGGQRARDARFAALNRRMFLDVFPRALRSFLPWYSPRSIPVPPSMVAAAERYTREATSARG